MRALRELAGRDIRPIRVAFAHARNADLPEFARFFGCPVEFGRAADEGVASDLLEFSNAAVAAPLLTADPKLLKALEPFCDMAAKERRTASDTLRAAVEKEAEKLLPHGNRAENARAADPDGGSARSDASESAGLSPEASSLQPTPPPTTHSTSNAISRQPNHTACYAPRR